MVLFRIQRRHTYHFQIVVGDEPAEEIIRNLELASLLPDGETYTVKVYRDEDAAALARIGLHDDPVQTFKIPSALALPLIESSTIRTANLDEIASGINRLFETHGINEEGFPSQVTAVSNASKTWRSKHLGKMNKRGGKAAENTGAEQNAPRSL